MLNAEEILGMNARNLLYVSQNSGKAKRIANSKLETKLLMNEREISAPKVFAILKSQEEVESYEWTDRTADFVIKPSNGSGGKGIAVFRKMVRPGVWRDTVNHEWTEDEIVMHCLDILEGKYSSHVGAKTEILIEERIPIHQMFLKFSYGGTPDVRVIVYNRVPVMAMLRLPTKESEGRANLHQGALGVGIDLATGVTTYAITGDGIPIKYAPETKRKLNGILIPFWKKLLLTAVRAAEAADVTFGGIDLFVHSEKGPMVVELNVRPGLSIQVANQKGLKKRLRRIDGLNIMSAEHGVKIAQTLFATELIGKVIDKDQQPVIGFTEEITLIGEKVSKKKSKQIVVTAKVDTARYRSAISRAVAEELGLYSPDNLLWYQSEKVNAEGNGEGGENDTPATEKAPVIAVSFVMGGKKVATTMVVSRQLDRGKIKVKLGRADLNGFLVTSQNGTS